MKGQKLKIGDDIYISDANQKYFGVVTKVGYKYVWATFGTDEPLKHLKTNIHKN